MRFIVDGYNVTMADDATRRLPRGEQRDALVRRLSVRGEDVFGTGGVTVVFDGHHGSAVAGSGRIDVRFSRGESADDVIVALAAASTESLVVVTSDRELRSRVTSATHGPVEFRGCSSLFEARVRRAPRRSARGRFPASTAGLPKGANKITEELKSIWLDESDGKARE